MDNSTTVDSVFQERFSNLMKERGITQAEASDGIGVTRQAISLYATGKRTPDINSLYKIADFFKVSTDYLLGLSDVQSLDLDVKAISEKTGLSEKSVNAIVERHNPQFVKEGKNLVEWKDHFMKMTNLLIESGWLESVLFRLDFYFYNVITVYELEKHFISKEDLKKRDEALYILEKNPAANIVDVGVSVGEYNILLKDAIKMGFEKTRSPIMDLTVDKEYLSYKLCKDIEKDITTLLAENYERIKPLSYAHDDELEKIKEAISELLIELGEEIEEMNKEFE